MEDKIKSLAKVYKQYLLTKIQQLPVKPALDIILIGDDFASKKYVSKKQKFGAEIGLDVNLITDFEDIDNATWNDYLENVGVNNKGLIIQLPAPTTWQERIQDIPYFLDVDFLGKDSSRLWLESFLPPTIQSIDLIIKLQLLNQDFSTNFENFINHKLDLSGLIISVVGQGALVGSPLLKYLSSRQATIISINEFSPNPTELTTKSNILISAVGKSKLINKDWVNPETIIIDAGTSESSGSLVGDVDTDNIYTSNPVSPTPGGVGKLTVSSLFYNLLTLSQKFNS